MSIGGVGAGKSVRPERITSPGVRGSGFRVGGKRRLLTRDGNASDMRVLLGIGGSEDSVRALERTVARAVEAGDDLTVAVVENPDSEMAVEAVRERVESLLRESAVDADVLVLEGHAGSRLVEVAEGEGFDRLVLGGGETSPLGKVTLGEIAEFVILNANTSVTLVR
jgi:nucleotide-binding universal stress UspA family protein